MLAQCYVGLLVGFELLIYSTSESSGSTEVTVTISGGLSAIPITIMVTTTEQTATGGG